MSNASDTARDAEHSLDHHAKPEAAAGTDQANEPEKLASPLLPLLWLLIPFVLVILYGLLSPN